MSKQKTYSANEVCEELNISNWTLSNWYRWENKRVQRGTCKPYLPKPEKRADLKGKPRFWTQKQLDELRKYKESIVLGRNGIYGEYSNPNYVKKVKE